MTPPGIQMAIVPPRPRVVPGTCRVCGCTDEHACVLEWIPLDRFAAGDGELPVPAVTCSWVESDLCTRCHGPRHPTRRQAGELVRIQTAKGPITVHPGHDLGVLIVHLVGRGRGDKHPILSLSADGRAVSTYVPPQESEAA